jgi:hypothetical protein
MVKLKYDDDIIFVYPDDIELGSYSYVIANYPPYCLYYREQDFVSKYSHKLGSILNGDNIEEEITKIHDYLLEEIRQFGILYDSLPDLTICNLPTENIKEDNISIKINIDSRGLREDIKIKFHNNRFKLVVIIDFHGCGNSGYVYFDVNHKYNYPYFHNYMSVKYSGDFNIELLKKQLSDHLDCYIPLYEFQQHCFVKSARH